MNIKLKFSWGTRIFLLYTGFVAMIIFFVITAMNQKVDLVADDYYKRELAYQDQIDMTRRASALSQPLSWQVKEDGIHFDFPPAEQPVQGTIFFFRPSDRALDKLVEIEHDAEGSQVVMKELLTKGLYRVQVTWKDDKDSYYREGVIVLR